MGIDDALMQRSVPAGACAARPAGQTTFTLPSGQVTVTPQLSEGARVALYVAYAASIGASTYHGYRRNDSIGWAIWWALMGGIFPIITPAVAIAQGFGESHHD